MRIWRCWEIKLFLKITHLVSGKARIVLWLPGQEGCHRLGSSPNRPWGTGLGTKSLFGKWSQEALWQGGNVRQVTPWTSGAQSCWETSERLWELRETLARILGWLIYHLPFLVVNCSSSNTSSTSCPPLNCLKLSHSQQMPSEERSHCCIQKLSARNCQCRPKGRGQAQSPPEECMILRKNGQDHDLALDLTSLSDVQLKSMWQVNLTWSTFLMKIKIQLMLYFFSWWSCGGRLP